jgi:hypothetical protein
MGVRNVYRVLVGKLEGKGRGQLEDYDSYGRMIL